MRIVLSCCGEGFGHAARLVALAQELNKRHNLLFFCPPPVITFVASKLSDVEIIPIPYLFFIKKEGRVRYLPTIVKNAKTIFLFPWIVRNIRRKLVAAGAEAVITDFDPFTSIAAWREKIPILEVNHPGIILKSFSINPDALISKLTALFMMSFFHHKMICSFYNGDVGPIIRDEILHAETRDDGFFLVYMNGICQDLIKDLLEVLQDFPYKIFPSKDEDFVEALMSCRGVIATAGHQLISEAAYLHKPLYVIPQQGQYEQRYNARMLEYSGRGMQGDFRSLNATLPEFIRSIHTFPRVQKEHRVQYNFSNCRGESLLFIEAFLDTAANRPVNVGNYALMRMMMNTVS